MRQRFVAGGYVRHAVEPDDFEPWRGGQPVSPGSPVMRIPDPGES